MVKTWKKSIPTWRYNCIEIFWNVRAEPQHVRESELGMRKNPSFCAIQPPWHPQRKGRIHFIRKLPHHTELKPAFQARGTAQAHRIPGPALASPLLQGKSPQSSPHSPSGMRTPCLLITTTLLSCPLGLDSCGFIPSSTARLTSRKPFNLRTWVSSFIK